MIENTLQIIISYLYLQKNLHYPRKYSFGDILRKFDTNRLCVTFKLHA